MEAETSTPEAEAPQAEGPNLSLLAKGFFGDSYHGEVTEPAKAEEPVETESETVEAEEPLETAEESEEAPESTEPDEVPISTVQELIEAGEYDPEWFDSLEVDVKVDGESKRAKLADLRNSYQMQQAAEKRLEDAKEKAKAINEELSKKREELDASLNVVGGFLKDQLDAIDKEESEVDWKTLRNQDPGEAAIKRQEFADRKAQVKAKASQLYQTYQQTQYKAQQEANEKQAEVLQREQEALLEALPEWKDDETAAKEKAKLGEYLADVGLSQESLSQVTLDHKLLIMARKANLYDEIKSKSEPAKKKLVKVPKTLKPGASKPETDVTQKQIQQLQDQINRNPNSRDALMAATEIAKLKRKS